MTAFEVRGPDWSPRSRGLQPAADALLAGEDWRAGFTDDICIGLWLWGAGSRPSSPPGCAGRSSSRRGRATQRELWLWLLGDRQWDRSTCPAGRPGRPRLLPPTADRSLRGPGPLVATCPASAATADDRGGGPDAARDRARGQGPADLRLDELAPPLTAAAGGYSNAVYEHSSPVAARVRGGPDHHGPHQPVRHLHRLADRPRRPVPGADPDEVPESFYEAVGADGLDGL